MVQYPTPLTHCGTVPHPPHSLWHSTPPPSLTVAQYPTPLTHCGTVPTPLTHCGTVPHPPHSLWHSTPPPSLTVVQYPTPLTHCGQRKRSCHPPFVSSPSLVLVVPGPAGCGRLGGPSGWCGYCGPHSRYDCPPYDAVPTPQVSWDPV